ncbi:UNVERIFIED_CONTAM: hypothetical protein PYX00_005437 [Menopon gallinae]|uniref:RING-type E3 ubiquitin transferase n=1 Tax=Menopon gallinae TaxID=328185 RepID=A0AAW2HT17_9NEOP
MLVKSGQAEILRAAQRDANFLKEFHERLAEIVQRTLGIRTWMKYREFLRISSDVIYYSLTTLMNLQTLGEEYTGILQTHSSGKALQTKPVQIMMILLTTCGEKLVIESLKKFEGLMTAKSADEGISAHLLNISQKLRNLLPFFHRLNKAIFYYNGEYYQIGKRLTSTKYMLVRHWLKDRSTLPAFRLLGILSFLHLSWHMIQTYKKLKLESSKTAIRSQANTYVPIEKRCPLCLNNRTNTSSISCGHLFCWECIMSCLQEQPRCPLCRKAAQPSRVVLLQNY